MSEQPGDTFGAAGFDPGVAATESNDRGAAADPVPRSSPPSVVLHIEHLVLDGIRRNDGDRIGSALRKELARLLATLGLPARFDEGIALERLDAGELSVEEDETAERIGARLAQSIYRGLRR
jgi:hypothetical protein